MHTGLTLRPFYLCGSGNFDKNLTFTNLNIWNKSMTTQGRSAPVGDQSWYPASAVDEIVASQLPKPNDRFRDCYISTETCHGCSFTFITECPTSVNSW
jgi:hypothetical protein